jgi:hypothetical protein
MRVAARLRVMGVKVRMATRTVVTMAIVAGTTALVIAALLVVALVDLVRGDQE